MLTPEEHEAIAAESEAMKSKASVGVINAEPISGWNLQFFSLEVSGISIDVGMGEQRVSGDVVLGRESLLAAMFSMGQALGEPGATAEFLSEQFGWEG